MTFFDSLVTAYNTFLTIFPPDLHWAVTLAILMVMIGLFIALVRRNMAFAFLAIPALILLFPVFLEFMKNMGAFFVYLLHTGPPPPH